MTRTNQGPRRTMVHVCGCYMLQAAPFGSTTRVYLPQTHLDAHTTIFSTAFSTVLTQTFEAKNAVDEIRYAFPLYDGVSIVNFKCQIGDRTVYGLVKEKDEAKATYNEAVKRGEKAALLEQLPDAADVFTTTIGNIPEKSQVVVTITYIGELKHDAEVDGIRYTLPTSIAPRYGSYPGKLMDAPTLSGDGVSITIDVIVSEDTPLQKIQSPTHPIAVSLGTLSNSSDGSQFSSNKASATLALGKAELDTDFVLQVVAKDVGVPQALLETHSSIPNHRALMLTLVPKFALKPSKPEIIFIADRSGSMGCHVKTLISAMQVFLKSLPVGVKFNIMSFGSRHELLWPNSKLYSQDALEQAMNYVDSFGADFGGTETFAAVKAAIESRTRDIQTEVMLLTDGDIWSQETLFSYLNEESKDGSLRVFPLGIGSGVSSSLIEGAARAGNGFSQMVADGEKLSGKLVRMLKGALTPHVKDYSLEIKYGDDAVDKVSDSLQFNLNLEEDDATASPGRYPLRNKPMSLYDAETAKQEEKKHEAAHKDRFAHLPPIPHPKLLQTPHTIPPLFPFNRTCVYVLLSPETSDSKPTSVILRGTSPQGPLELEIPIQALESPGATIHQLAARKATQELEEGRGWIHEARIQDNKLVREAYAGHFDAIVQREAVRLGVQFQVGGKFCSFVAVEANEAEIVRKRKQTLAKVENRAKESGDESFDLVGYSDDDLIDYSDDELATGESASAAAVVASVPAKRKSTGGNAPRKQLASKAARKSAPTLPPAPAPPAPGSLGGRVNGGRGFSKGGAMRHRKILPDSAMDIEAEVDEDEEEEDEDEDMAIGFFDDSPAPAPMAAVASKGQQSASPKPMKKRTVTGGTLIERLVQKQAFDGSWSREDLECDAMGIEEEKARELVVRVANLDSFKNGETAAATVVATALVVLYLETKAVEEKDTWELVVEKARTWLEDAVSVEDLETVFMDGKVLVAC